jgi:CubicO group peptidase (beta-lactamase class C family)
MKRLILITIAVAATAHPASAGFDYNEASRKMIRNGVQAVLTCNGLYTSGRSLSLVMVEELEYLRDPRFGGDVKDNVQLHDAERAVTIGGGADGIAITAAFREGIGCVVMAPDQGIHDILSLPELTLPYPDLDPATTPWPNGDLIEERPWPAEIDAAKLDIAANRILNPEAENHVTLSLIVVHKGNIVLERYRDGVRRDTKTRTWSTAKSIAVTLIGMLVDEGRLSLDGPIELDWLPDVRADDYDPRDAITLRNVLHMSSGLYPVDSFDMEYATGSGLAYWAGFSSSVGARQRGLIREPGTFWDYENYDTLLAVLAMKRTIGDPEVYLEFPRRRLLDRIGMRNTLLSTDRFGDFILSSQVYTTARDLARFGLLYLNGGVWDGERLISEEWIDFVRTPAPASAVHGNFYGGQFWLVPDDRHDVPRDAYSTAGNRGQYVIIIPSLDLVIVRRGLDFSQPHMLEWDIAATILAAFPTWSPAQNGE